MAALRRQEEDHFSAERSKNQAPITFSPIFSRPSQFFFFSSTFALCLPTKDSSRCLIFSVVHFCAWKPLSSFHLLIRSDVILILPSRKLLLLFFFFFILFLLSLSDYFSNFYFFSHIKKKKNNEKFASQTETFRRKFFWLNKTGVERN